MSEAKHTPGPWMSTVQSDFNINIYHTRADGNGWYRVAMVPHPRAYLKSSRHMYAGSDEVGPNVALITAAPDLLAACKAIQAAMSKYGGLISGMFGHDEQFNDAVDAVDTAIDKATT